MSDSIFHRAKDVLGRVVELPDARRQAAIDELCAGDAALAAEVRSLLSHHAPDDRRLAPASRVRTLLGGLLGEDGEGTPRPAAGAADPDSTAFDPWRDGPAVRLDGPLRPGARVGSFVLGERLGSGGMGVVYEARQDAPRRTVALKIVAGTGGVSPELLRRFRREVHVLGRLEHPGIAALYEAGAVETDEGLRPYFAMQRVDGLPLVRWVERHAPAPERLVEVVAAVCDAVAHAHARGVVHRDLKPGNVLVDAAGRPTVLDFGVARLDDAHSDLTSLHTEAGSLLGTLPYMSPEQVSGRLDAVDARTDVYALGVLLFEALAGRLPLAVDGLSVPAAALVIQREEPSRLDDVAPAIDPGLALIVDTALAKEPERRYADATALADDLRRWLAGQDLHARPLSALQRAGRFVRRHRALTAGVFVAFASLVVALVVSLDQAASERRIRRQAEREADRAKVIAAAAALDAGEPLAALERLEAVSADGRGWEWRYHRQRLQGGWRGWEAGESLVGAALSGPDEVVEIHRDGRLVRRRLADLVIVEEGPLVPAGSLASVDIDGAGRRLVAHHRAADGDRDAALILDLVDGEVLRREAFVEAGVVRGIAEDGRSAAWFDGDRLVLWEDDGEGGRLASQQLSSQDTRTEGFQRVRTLVYGRRVAFLGQFGTVSFLDGSRPEAAVAHHRVGNVRPPSGTFSRDGSRFLVGLTEGSLLTVDPDTGEALPFEGGHRGPVDEVATLADGRRVVSVGRDGTLRTWDLVSRRLVDVRSLTGGRVLGLAPAPVGERVLLRCPDGRVVVHDLTRSARCDVLAGHERYVYDVDVLPDGTVASVSWDRTVRFWSADGVRSVPLERRGGMIRSSPLGDALVVRTGARLLRLDGHGTGPPRDLAVVRHATTAGAWLPDGRGFLSERRQDRQSMLVLLDPRDGDLLAEVPAGPSRLLSLAVTEGGRRLVSGHADGSLRRWSLPGLELLGQRGGLHEARVVALAATPRGDLVASGCEDGAVQLVDARTLEPLAVLPAHPGTVWDLAFHPDGTRLATACHDGVVRLFDVPDGQPVTQLRGHADYVKGLAWSPDGTFLVSGSGDHTLRVWHSVPLAER